MDYVKGECDAVYIQMIWEKLYYKYHNTTNSCSKLLKSLIFLNFVIIIILNSFVEN